MLVIIQFLLKTYPKFKIWIVNLIKNSWEKFQDIPETKDGKIAQIEVEPTHTNYVYVIRSYYSRIEW